MSGELRVTGGAVGLVTHCTGEMEDCCGGLPPPPMLLLGKHTTCQIRRGGEGRGGGSGGGNIQKCNSIGTGSQNMQRRGKKIHEVEVELFRAKKYNWSFSDHFPSQNEQHVLLKIQPDLTM